ncbi:zinc finger protein 568-like [Odontomachus brunneus]|uniref:zinc finger protein 568-like n=1 Tax=Odontomachus brunneus TaxID=486640 RepID=UPI0013F1C3B9|nr:zinc finger protein 568-like [Odontomachus brunneus]
MSSEIYCIDMCRACMKTDGVLLSVYDDDIKPMNLPHKLMDLTSVQINRFDGLPSKFCYKCAYRIQVLYEFKYLVRETHKTLLKMFGKQKHILKKKPLDKNDDMNISTQMNEIIKFILPSDQSTDTPENVTTEIVEETNNNTEEVMVNISHFLENYDDIKESNLSWDDVANLQGTGEMQIDEHPMKTKEPEKITKIFDSEQYTIVYVPESAMESTEQISIFDMDKEKSEKDCNTLEAAVEILEKQEEMIEKIPPNVCASSLIEFEVYTKEKDSSYSSTISKNDSMENKEASENNVSKIEQFSAQAENTDESDSDYFIDHKDNILGSLNDTIMRIKEVRKGDLIMYQCTLCLQNYKQLSDMLLHTIDNHVPSSGPFYCVVCEKDCESHRELRAHAKTHTGIQPYSCFICDKAYAVKRYLKRHMACHVDLPRFRCPKCGIRFTVKTELDRHMTTHLRGAPFACSQCSRTFNHKGNYKRHLITHLDPHGLQMHKYPCKICGKRFPNNRTLETHVRVHTGERPFSCEICSKSFSQQGNLLNHVRIHSNPRKYRCDICDKSFNQRATLRDHQLLHTGEKPHVCNICGIAFTFSAALRRHMWSHETRKPFKCDTCNAEFIGKYDLRRHSQVHKNQAPVKMKKPTLKLCDVLREEFNIEDSVVTEEPDNETVLTEQVLQDDVTEVVHQAESEKENVDALFNFI